MSAAGQRPGVHGDKCCWCDWRWTQVSLLRAPDAPPSARRQAGGQPGEMPLDMALQDMSNYPPSLGAGTSTPHQVPTSPSSRHKLQSARNIAAGKIMCKMPQKTLHVTHTD